MHNFGWSILWYWCAYLVVTAIGVAHTAFNAMVLHMGIMSKEPRPMKEIESYAKTMPFHPLYNLLVFPVFAWLYLSGLTAPSWTDALLTGAVWLGVTAVIDLVGWVLIPHPWHCSFKDFYVDYQPWIFLIYLVIFASPLLAFLFL